MTKKFKSPPRHAGGVFDTCLVLDGRVVFLQEHMRRLRRSARQLKLGDIPSDVAARIDRLLATKRARYGRLNFYCLPKPAGFSMKFLPMKKSALFPLRGGKPVWIALAKESMHHPYEHKHIDRAFFDRLRNRYVKGRVWETLYTDRAGNIVEGTRTNVFLVKNRAIFTPPLASGSLPGITRHKVIEAAKQAGISVKQRPVSLGDLRSADEAFLTSSLRGILPISRICSVAGFTTPGPVTRRLQNHYVNTVKRHLRQK